MFKIPLWKSLFCIIVVLISILFSLPTFFGPQKFLPDSKINLGLDLRGGSSILLGIDFEAFDKEIMLRYLDEIKLYYKNEKLQIPYITLDNTKLVVDDDLKLPLALKSKFKIQKNDNKFIYELVDNKKLHTDLITQSIEVIRRRIDESGTKEIDLQTQGEDILLQVPGVKDSTELKKLLGRTAKLTFHLVSAGDEYGSTKYLPMQDMPLKKIPIQSKPILTGDMLDDARVTLTNGTPVVSFKLNNMGARLFAEATANNIGKHIAIILDDVIISAPSVREPITGGTGQISGGFSVASANELALLLRAGALPAPLTILEERSVGPSLGTDSINAGAKAVLIGGLLVLITMFITYYWFGIVANIALIINLFMIIAILSILEATLTLPGIAGIALTLGMAVDANVLIFERIREELSQTQKPFLAIEAGYKAAFTTIVDSNITTILAGVILYIFGAGPIRGFAVTLIIGILCSMFTAITITKVIIGLYYKRNREAPVIL